MVRNKAKLAYTGVGAWLEGTASAPAKVTAVAGLEEQLRTQDRAAQAMKTLRHQRGALSLDTIEPRAVFDGDAISDLRPDEKNRAAGPDHESLDQLRREIFLVGPEIGDRGAVE